MSEQLQLNVQWALNPSSVPIAANNLLIAEGVGIGASTVGMFELHVGHVSPPPIFAENEEEAKAIMENMTVFVNSVGHYSVTVDALRQMQETISEALRKFDAARN